MTPKWHFYDQGFLYSLGNNQSGRDIELFMEHLGKELDVDLFSDSPGFKIVHNPFSFLEAIGCSSFPRALDSVMDNVLREFESEMPKILAGSKSITILPMIVVKEYQKHFLSRSELSSSSLVLQAERQIKRIQNPVTFPLIEQIIQFPLNELRNPERSEVYRRATCDFLSIEFTQQFPFYDFLSKSYPNNAQRKVKTQEIYHAFFQMAEDAIKTKRNLSYFRSLDRARNIFALQADAVARSGKEVYKDPYRSSKSHLENNKDGLDSYLVHFAVCGFFSEDKNHQTLSFTLDSPEIIRNRLTYALQMLNWIKDCKEHSFQLNPGIIYCFNHADLKIVDKIQVDTIEYTPIPRE